MTETEIEWVEYDHDPGYIHALVDGHALGHVRLDSSGWYAKHGTVTRLKLGLSSEFEAKEELRKMIDEHEGELRRNIDEYELLLGSRYPAD